MIKANVGIEQAKKYVDGLKGKKINVTVNLGRNKFSYYIGVLSGVYPALFTVSPTDEFRGKTSFSYSELLCGGVRLKSVN